ncbi:hypothetical protein [Roseococcus pinisoli]|uniref:Uncharacterized protein n=1 Tax=Roseococcus pinisoli TaxID=2835040 RepID=A0ABS5QFY5_9PROT|nr:hypothetical protein [Roseococcus pinisoli]MBS7812288.1 hypothetical protein [Roseococcus pinisoli]
MIDLRVRIEREYDYEHALAPDEDPKPMLEAITRKHLRGDDRWEWHVLYKSGNTAKLMLAPKPEALE